MPEDETQSQEAQPAKSPVDWGRHYVQPPPPDPAARLQVYEAALQRIARYEPRFHHWQAQLLIEIATEALAWKK